MSDVKRLNFTVSQFESVVPYASEHGQYVRFADYAKLEAEAHLGVATCAIRCCVSETTVRKIAREFGIMLGVSQ